MAGERVEIKTTFNIPLETWQAFEEACRRELRDPVEVFQAIAGPAIHEALEHATSTIVN